MKQIRNAISDLTGRNPAAHEKDKWREVAEIIVGELKSASSKANSVSSVPAFLAEHLRRRLMQPTLPKEQGNEKPKRKAHSVPQIHSESQEIRELNEH